MSIAARCYWEEGNTDRILTNKYNTYKVAVGKYTSDISIKDNNFTQIIDVGIIFHFRTKHCWILNIFTKQNILGVFNLSKRELLWVFWVLCR